MRTFKEMNKAGGSKCPICQSQREGEVVLIGIVGTQEDNNVEAAQFHLACIDLMWDKKAGFIYQILVPEKVV